MKPARKPSKSALFDAAKRWDAAAVTALLEAAPALAGATDPKGRTALHIACAVPPGPGLGEPNGIATATALLKAGADPRIRDDRGRDAVDVAKARRLPKGVIARLERLGARA